MLDCDLKIRLFTPSAQKILNISASDTGLPITNVRLAILIPELEKNILDVIKNFSRKNMDVIDKNGHSYELRIRPYIAEEKTVDGAVLSFIDIDVLKKHEDEIKAEKEKFRTLAENSPDIISRFDRNLHYLYVNSSVKEISKVYPKNFIGKTNEETDLPKKFAESWNRVLQNVVQTGKVEKGEFEFSSLKEKRIYQYVIVPEFSVNNSVETVLSLIEDITERKKTEEALRKSEEEYSSLFTNMLDGFAFCQMIFDEANKPVDFVYLQINDAFERITGLKRDKVVGKKVTEAIPGIKASNPELFEIYGRVALTSKKEKFELFFKPLSQWLSIAVYSPRKGYFAAVFEDITERKKTETEREIMVEFLRIANASTGTRGLIKGALGFFQKQCDCAAVGIRLKEGEDYPYYETKGFPPEHIQIENKLCASDKDGCVIRDSKGKIILECMCGNIICGRFDPSKKFFTENGSFWTNSTTQLLANTTAADRQGNTRNRCNSEGYESLALIPLSVGGTRLGLLQLNDKRKGMFTLETILMWERIADRLALALSKTIAEEALRKSEVKFRTVADFAYNWEYWIDPDGNMVYV
jgi:PAS domain S-box-containing protein